MRRHRVIGTLAAGFGALTILSGGSVLFGPQGIREAAGDVVLPVLWFNVLSGLAYVAAGLGLVAGRTWARALSWGIAAAIGVMLAVLVALILAGSPWEPRTLAAMTLRLTFWVAVALLARPVRA